MAKRIMCFIFILALCCSGCAVNPDGAANPSAAASNSGQPSSSTATEPTASTPTIPLRPYNDPPILTIQHVYHRDAPDQLLTMDADSAAMLLSVWRDMQWRYGNLKYSHKYVFECDGSTLGYAPDVGVFNDIQNDRCLELTEDQRIAVNQLIHEVFFAENKVEPIAPSGCGQYIVEVDWEDIGCYYQFHDSDCAEVISFAQEDGASYQNIKYKWEHYEEFTSNDVERSYDAEQEALIYRYTTRSGIRMMLVVYSFQTEEYSYTVYEEYELDRSEEIPQSVKFLGTNGRDYFYVVVNGPTEQITKEWISQWGIQA